MEVLDTGVEVYPAIEPVEYCGPLNGQCLFIELSTYFIFLPFTGRVLKLPEFAFTGFHPVSFLPDRRKIHSKHYGAPARANSPPLLPGMIRLLTP